MTPASLSPPPHGASGDPVPPWLRALPQAPEFHPTAAEFADPVAYLLRIEPAAAPFGICKVVPPCPPPPRKSTLATLARSFAADAHNRKADPGTPPTFPARHQQLGRCPRRARPAVHPVWLSARRHTLQQFEARAAAARGPLLARLGEGPDRRLSPLDHDALFWRAAAAADRPFSVDYASDMPGSGFGPCAARPGPAQATHVGETAWNMRGAARSPGSLLRFMRDDVPGVSTPMLYVAMLFSWFAWHVEDHDLHSLNYLHFGAAKTWYGVPRDAARAFEDVVRLHGYGADVNPLEAFATLGKKTTVLSPEVLVDSGVPCCRDPSIGAMEPRSSRLKEKKKGEGGQLVKKLFVQNAIQDDELLSSFLNDGSSCIILPINDHDGPVLSALRSRSQLIPQYKLPDVPCNSGETLEASRCIPLNEAFDKNRDTEGDKVDVISAAGLLDQGLLSCVSCGILSFSCVAVIKPRECASRYFMSSDHNSINDQLVGSGGSHLANATGNEGTNGGILQLSFEPHGNEILPDAGPVNRNSAPDLLASAYGNQPDPNEDNRNKKIEGSDELDGAKISSYSPKCQQKPSFQSAECVGGSGISNGPRGVRTRNKYRLKMALAEGFQLKNNYWATEQKVQPKPSMSKEIVKEPLDASGADYDARCNKTAISVGDPRGSTTMMDSLNQSIVEIDKDSSRMHVFCLEHAVEVEKQLQAIGGAHVIFLCRPEYLKIEAEARSLAAEMEVEHGWKDIHFREANMEDRKMIEQLLQDEESIPTSSDWAVKLGTNLYYSANVAKSAKQMPYNRVIYEAFGCSPPDNSPAKLKTCEGSQGDRQKKIVLAGRWCGKAWMSNQVHPFLAQRIESSELEETDNPSGVEDSKRNGSAITDVQKSSKKTSMTLEETTDTKRPRQAEEHSPRESKGVGEVPHPSPTGAAPRVSSRIANREANKVKTEMTEEDDGPKSKVTSHSRKRSPPHKKTEAEARKQMKMTSKGDKATMAPASAAKGPSVSSAAKLESSSLPRKRRTRTEAVKQPKKRAATGEERRAPGDHHPTHVQEYYTCSVEGCSMSFDTKKELSLHGRDICPVKGCRKKFLTHKYLLQHRKVHADDRPLKCPWEGCGVAFKWAWARTEHLRVHTGDRPYVCDEPGCKETFRFVSDSSRHKRETGHSTKQAKTKAKA